MSSTPVYRLQRLLPNQTKKFQIILPSGQRVRFGAQGYSDYPTHHDAQRMQRYVARHQAREDWTAHGLHTPGFWSRWLLWNLPSFTDSLRDTERRFHVRIIRERLTAAASAK